MLTCKVTSPVSDIEIYEYRLHHRHPVFGELQMKGLVEEALEKKLPMLLIHPSADDHRKFNSHVQPNHLNNLLYEQQKSTEKQKKTNLVSRQTLT